MLDRGAGVAYTKRIVVTLAALGEGSDPFPLAYRVNGVSTTGENLVRIALMPHIPDETIIWCVKHEMQRHRELERAQTRAKVPSRLRYRLD